MKRILASLMVALGIFATSPAMAAVIVQFFPEESHVAVGDSVEVEMRISGLDDEILSAFNIYLLFNSSVVSNTALIRDYEDHFGLSIFLGGLGDLDLRANSLEDDQDLLTQPNDFVVFTFTFQGLADGFSFITLGSEPHFQRNFVGLGAQSLAVTVIGACISVGEGQCVRTVPEPSTLSMLALALCGATLLRVGRRRV